MSRSLVCLLQFCWTLLSVTAIPRSQLFPFGTLHGDVLLQEGDDETSQVMSLTKPMYFYETSFSNLYVATNGIISTQDLPMEKQYVDDGFPTEFPVIAPFLADIDTSGGKGAIYYRQTESPAVLNRVASEVEKGFGFAGFAPTHAVITTWENVAPYQEPARNVDSSHQVNTFQAVVAYDEENTYALFLYPDDGLNFFGTRPKETFNVEIELPARVGFTRGEIPFLIFSRTEGPYYSVTSNEQSVKNLYQTGNTGVPGVWLFHIGNAYSFDNVIPASAGAQIPTAQPRRQSIMFPTTPEYPELEYPETESPFDEEHEYHIDPDFQNPTTPEFPELDRDTQIPDLPDRDTAPEAFPVTHDIAPAASGLPSQNARIQLPVPEQTLLEVHPDHAVASPPHAPEREVVNVDEDVDFNSGVIHYSTENKETCERFQQHCSQNAFCVEYTSGYCCHCRSGFYGNGRHCLPSGAPQRVNGKVNGVVSVRSTPVVLNDVDLHAYVVVGDGRAYTAISQVPEPLGWALLPAAPIGGLFGWLFALKLPHALNGFNITGAEFTRHADVTFYPGNQQLRIVQTGRGLDGQNHLKVDTRLEGSVPFVSPGATVQMEPYKETYHYYPSLITSSLVWEFTVVSAESGAQTFSYQLRQNITFGECRHAPRFQPQTLQLHVERIFVMYVKEERILRYAITNKIGQPGAEVEDPERVNPCYSGSHDCDTSAQCLPGEGQLFTCQCATGYAGDGRNCYDVDECAEGLSSCTPPSRCVNLPGSYSCQCQSGFEFSPDGRSCADIDECQNHPCHSHASCSNVPGSFHCRCLAGYHGDGFHCQSVRPKSQCEHHRDSVQAREDGLVLEGAFVPQCDEQGHYRPLQCHGSTGHCWCVDEQGQEKAGTRTPPGSPPTNCAAPVRSKSQCEHHRDSVQARGDSLAPVGAFVPQCDEEGHYRPLQCHGSTGHCWCVDKQGQERAGTRTPPGSPPTNCAAPARPKKRCEHHRDSVQAREDGLALVGAFVPQCDEQGHYRPLQCHGSTGHCWCVDEEGQERAGTRTPPGSPPTNCAAPARPKTRCEHHRDSVQVGEDGLVLEGGFVPQCDELGHYRPLQCHGSTGHCWCVDEQGQEKAGTRTPPGSPPTNCAAPARPKTRCEHHRDSVQVGEDGLVLEGGFVPQCDEQGHYRPLQCHGSTGHCWCVDEQGQEKAGTRTPPGSPPTNCAAPAPFKTQCEHHRDGVQAREDGLALVGAFVPQCDEEGHYRPLQCHGSTGHCWCVDAQGQEKAGTRTPPGSPPTNCAAPARPKTQCEHHRDSVHPRGDSLAPAGAFVPQCDEQGHYRPLQCHGSTGHCWCVNTQGQERPGTRTPPGSPPTNCHTPVVPVPTQRPASVCERWKASLIEHHGGWPGPEHYLPQCDSAGEFIPVQCYGDSSYCWCVDKDGREVPGTRSHDAVKPACIPSVAPPTVRPLPRPDVTPPPTGTSLLYAQGQQIGSLPLEGTQMNKGKASLLLALHGSIVVGIDYDCRERKVYWTDLAGRAISRAAIVSGAEPEIVINSGLVSPEGLAVDEVRRRLFWVDSSTDKIESANLDGSDRRLLFHTDLVNPRAIIVDSPSGTLYWTDWNRDAPKIESASVDGRGRRVLVRDGIGLPNALTFDPATRQVCWADAGTKRLECISADGSGRRVIHSNLNYPFSMVSYANHYYYTDWRRDGVLSVSRDASHQTNEFLPDQRSHLYGITVATTSC